MGHRRHERRPDAGPLRAVRARGRRSHGLRYVAPPLTHPDELQLADHANGLVHGAEADALDAHVAGCWRCRLVLTTHSYDTRQVDPIVGQDLGGYRIVERLAQGGTGLLYRGEERATKRPVVVKMLLPSLASDPKHMQRLLREARAVNLIRHPNVIDIFAVGQLEDAGIYLVMELLTGHTLAEPLRTREGLPVEKVESLLDQALAGLEAAHAAGVIHRDVKPENLFVQPRGDGWRLTVLDFGFAREAGAPRLTAPKIVIGTPGYLAPEQLRGDDAQPASDVYAMGVVAYELLTGRPPYEGPSQLAVMEAHLDAPVPSVRAKLPRVPPGLDALVAQMMAKDPAARPTVTEARRLLSHVRAERLEIPTMKEGVRPDPSLLRTVPDQRTPVKEAPLVVPRTNGPAIFLGLLVGAIAAWLLFSYFG